MNFRIQSRRLLAPIAFAVLTGGCAAPPVRNALPDTAMPPAQSVLRSVAIDRDLEDRILALDPQRITEDDVARTLSKAPAPRIILMHGGIYPVYLMMTSAGRFLVGMGYPEDRIRHPGDRRWSHSPYEDSAHVAGLIAWYYEHDGVRPMLIGHSHGGTQAIKVLYDLAGRFDNPIPVWDPYTDEALGRTEIRDPLTGVVRPVVGVTVSYASSIGAGGLPLVLPNAWSMTGKVHSIPDSVEDFTGFSIGLDVIAWTLSGVEGTTEFRHSDNVEVRSVVLPAVYNHVTVPFVGPVAEDPAAREWIYAYKPGLEMPDPPRETVGYAMLWAADVWYSVRKHWALEAQRLIRAKRAALGQP